MNWINAKSTYNTVATPTFSTTGGTCADGTSVSLATATSGATIYYTTDGSTPTTSSNVYSGNINLCAQATTYTTTITAYAVKNGYKDSESTSATYTVNPPPD